MRRCFERRKCEAHFQNLGVPLATGAPFRRAGGPAQRQAGGSTLQAPLAVGFVEEYGGGAGDIE